MYLVKTVLAVCELGTQPRELKLLQSPGTFLTSASEGQRAPHDDAIQRMDGLVTQNRARGRKPR